MENFRIHSFLRIQQRQHARERRMLAPALRTHLRYHSKITCTLRVELKHSFFAAFVSVSSTLLVSIYIVTFCIATQVIRLSFYFYKLSERITSRRRLNEYSGKGEKHDKASPNFYATPRANKKNISLTVTTIFTSFR